MQAWMVVHALINGYGRTQPGCRDDLLAFLFQLSYCKVRAAFKLLGCRLSFGEQPPVGSLGGATLFVSHVKKYATPCRWHAAGACAGAWRLLVFGTLTKSEPVF